MSTAEEPSKETMLTSLNDILPTAKKTVDDEDEWLPEELINPDPLSHFAEMMEKLSKNQSRFLTQKLQGMNDSQAARKIGLQPATVYKWKNDPTFLEVYQKVVKAPVEVVATMTSFGFAKAMLKLTEMLEDNRVAVRQYAIDRIIEMSGVNNKTKKSEVKVEITRGDIDRILDAQ